MCTPERSTRAHLAVVNSSSNPERIVHSTTPPHESSFTTAQLDDKHDTTAALRTWEAILNADRDDDGKGKIVKAESNAQDKMDTEVQTQDAKLAMTRTEIQELIAAKTRSAHEMIANEMASINDKALHKAFQSATLSAQRRFCTVVYDLVEQVY